MAEVQKISRIWNNRDCIIAAPGPSLTADVVRQCRIARMAYSWKLLLVQDAYRAFKYADALYGCDARWWKLHKDCGFDGPRWTSHDTDGDNNKLNVDPELGQSIADAFGLNVVLGKDGDQFSSDPSYIYYGSNSGFQALNLALLFGVRRVVLVGYDMRHVGGLSHFFGDHQAWRQNGDTEYQGFVQHFARAVPTIPKDVSIVNATPGSALNCFPMMSLGEALGGSPKI